MRQAVFFLLYAAVVIRAVAYHFYDDPVPPLLYGLMAVYGLVLLSEPWVKNKVRGYTLVYLVVQTGLILGMQLTTPSMDFLPSLYYPLCFLAVLYYGRRIGFLWIGAFVLLFTIPVLVGWEWEVPGVATVIIDGAASFFVGSYAHLIQQSDRARVENQELLVEVQEAYRKLQDHAVQIEELAIQQERDRMARELHDSVTQTIFSMNLTVQAARMVVEKDLQQVAAHLDRLQDLARGAIGEIQVLVSQLRPRSLTTDGLPAALRRLSEERLNRDGLRIHLEVNGEQELPQPVMEGLYRVVQEALNNIAKHAKTREATVRLDFAGQPAYLEVEDHGCGFEPEQAARDLQHIGLAGMADRARELGWKLIVKSQVGSGTLIRVEEAAG